MTNKKCGFRLGKRKLLTDKRRFVSNCCLVCALFGIVAMIVETEMTMANVYDKSSKYSCVMKSLVTISTAILLHLILIYYRLQAQLFIVNNSLGDWRVALSWPVILQATLEIVVCSIHPFPGDIKFIWKSVSVDDDDDSHAVSIDLLLTFPMFLRFYLVGRVMLLHSRILTDASAVSIGALNRISFNVRFVLKTLMNICPGTVLVVFMLTVWILASWTLRVCECYHDPKHKNFLNSLWMIAITFLSVGYGDIVPRTYCGRSVAVFTGVMGSGCTALVVAVFARKMELTRAERHVHNFMIDNQLSKKLKHAAANVLRETWFIYKYTILADKLDARKIRRHQAKFLTAIHTLRDIRSKLRTLNDNANTMMDVSRHLTHSALNTTPTVYSSQPPAIYQQMQVQLSQAISDLYSRQLSTEQKTTSIEDNLNWLQNQLESLPEQVLFHMSAPCDSPSPLLGNLADVSMTSHLRHLHHQNVNDVTTTLTEPFEAQL
ncbi:hypothetical protein HELRODRAFT_108545 [Helobdella robusta]|uniref:Calmodulin-binding domain-containing protein n=1 Tax=Helobdella robusta TaxID=6412 RepID=T1EEK2_HELRO|nr:hypothetical protein HELRODRAFT_108545 [Helobdella robusta]ESN91821.1 hypothetical protein HELRODRAFT_108545 [Helobdella robusta]